MSEPARPGTASRPPARRTTSYVLVTDDEDNRRRLVALILSVAMIILGSVVGIAQAGSPSRHPPAARTAAVAHPPSGLIGGGTVAARRISGRLSAVGSVGDVLFAENSAVINHWAQEVIVTAAQGIRDRQAAVVTATGYTDALGTEAFNMQLSQRRAQTVLGALRQELDGTRIQYRLIARGRAAPVASNYTASGRQLNRRVVITVEPGGAVPRP